MWFFLLIAGPSLPKLPTIRRKCVSVHHNLFIFIFFFFWWEINPSDFLSCYCEKLKRDDCCCCCCCCYLWVHQQHWEHAFFHEDMLLWSAEEATFLATHIPFLEHFCVYALLKILPLISEPYMVMVAGDSESTRERGGLNIVPFDRLTVKRLTRHCPVLHMMKAPYCSRR